VFCKNDSDEIKIYYTTLFSLPPGWLISEIKTSPPPGNKPGIMSRLIVAPDGVIMDHPATWGFVRNAPGWRDSSEGKKSKI
jgi:hypothetical protein